MKFIPEPKQEWQVEQHTRNWLELPDDVMADILYRVGVRDILENAQKVCTTWYRVCKDPAMWRTIYMEIDGSLSTWPLLRKVFKHAVDRSHGQLVDISVGGFANHELLEYIADRSSRLRRLAVSCCYGAFYDGWTGHLKKFPLLEELSLYATDISKRDIEIAGRCCPMLATLKVTQTYYRLSIDDSINEELRNEIAIAIGQNLRELRYLELVGNYMSNAGVQVILDGCRHLESLDLSHCLYIDLEGDIWKKYPENIKHLKLPNDSYPSDDSEFEYDDPYADDPSHPDSRWK